MGYIVPMNLEVEIKCRVTREMKDHLQFLAKKEGSGVKVAALIRRAIEAAYFQTEKSPAIAYPIPEITALRAAEEPKKSRNQ